VKNFKLLSSNSFLAQGDSAMSNKNIERQHHQTFEELKQIGDSNAEFWYARVISDCYNSRLTTIRIPET
jgi:hypothetical protein